MLVALVAGARTLAGAPLALALLVAMLAGCVWMFFAMASTEHGRRHGRDEAVGSDPDRE